MYEIRVTLDDKDGKLIWSRTKSSNETFGNGTICNIQIITDRKPVWRVLVGAVDNAMHTLAGS